MEQEGVVSLFEVTDAKTQTVKLSGVSKYGPGGKNEESVGSGLYMREAWWCYLK